MVYHTDLFSSHLNPWSLTLKWCSEPLVFSITNLLEKLCVTVVKHPGSFNCLSFLHVGCWNVKRLVKMNGSIKTAIARPKCHPIQVDKKLGSLVKELKHFHMSMVGIIETKWFGNDVYKVDGFTVLHSGRSVPQSGDTIQCGEGVAIVLDPLMATSWMDLGNVVCC